VHYTDLHRLVPAAESQGWAPSKLQVYSWSVQLARALAFLHNCTPVVVHRDLKPCNLLLDSAGNLKVCDFGLSKIKEKIELTEAYQMTGKTGTFRYMAPEVFLDDPHYTEAVDIFSAAMLMWYFVTGVVPFASMPPQVTAQAAALTGSRPSLVDVNKRHSSVLSTIIERCWMQDPSRRPSALELVHDLELCYRVKGSLRREPAFVTPARCAQVVRACTGSRARQFCPLPPSPALVQSRVRPLPRTPPSLSHAFCIFLSLSAS
jgi:serine/threonine protein kinase